MTWGFLIDENLEPEIARYLRKEDHHAVAVQHVDELGKGTDDEEIVRYAEREELIVVTNNIQDFQDVSGEDAGVLALDAGRAEPFVIAMAILDVIAEYGQYGGAEAFSFDHLDRYL